LRVKVFLVLCLALVVGLLMIRWDVAAYFHPDRIRSLLAGAGRLAPLAYMGAMALAVVLSPIPSLPLNIAAGAFFGPFWGTVYSVSGALVGAVAAFSIARALGRDLIAPLLGGHINFCTDCSNRLLTKIVLLSRLLPMVSFDVISYGAGLTKMSLGHFALATSVGTIPLTAAYNSFGSILNVGRGVALIGGAVFVLLFFLIPRWIERYNLFSLRRLFHHGPGSEAGDAGKGQTM
jgi:uncharacterized membrane protein YdjX (TVP38/TMEM64 family)